MARRNVARSVPPEIRARLIELLVELLLTRVPTQDFETPAGIVRAAQAAGDERKRRGASDLGRNTAARWPPSLRAESPRPSQGAIAK